MYYKGVFEQYSLSKCLETVKELNVKAKRLPMAGSL